MTKIGKIITLSIIALIVAGFLLFYFGYVYAFRNFGEIGNWKPIKVYEFSVDKTTTEKKIRQTVSEDSMFMWLADSSYRFTKDGWFTIFVKKSTDTTEYIFRFKG